MTRDYRICIWILFLGIAAVGGIFSFPPLTTGESASSSSLTQVELDAMIDQELAHCRQLPHDINCRCFADVSVNVLMHNEPKVRGIVYADKEELARDQAKRSC